MQLMRLIPGRMTELFIGRSTERIANAANAMHLKDYQRRFPTLQRDAHTGWR